MANGWLLLAIMLLSGLAGFCFARATERGCPDRVELDEARDRVAYLEDYYGLDAHTVVMGGKEFGVEEPTHDPYKGRWTGAKPAAGRKVRRG